MDSPSTPFPDYTHYVTRISRILDYCRAASHCALWYACLADGNTGTRAPPPLR